MTHALDNRIAHWMNHVHAPHRAQLFARGLSLWVLLDTFVRALRHAENWGRFALPTPVPFHASRVLDWVFRLLLHDSMSPYYGVWCVVLMVSAVAGIVVTHNAWWLVVQWIALSNLDARAWFSVDGGSRLVELWLPLAASMQWGLRAQARWRVSWARDVAIAFANVSWWCARLQLMVVYVVAGGVKLISSSWRRGTALEEVMRHRAWSDPWVGPWMLEHPTWSRVATEITLLWECAFAVCLWHWRTRRWMLWLGVVVHVAIGQVMGIPFFSLAMLLGYVLFVRERNAQKVNAVWAKFRVGSRSEEVV